MAVDLDTRVVTVDGTPLQELRAMEFELLTTLAERLGKVFTKAEIQQALYGWDDFVGSRAVSITIGTRDAARMRRHSSSPSRPGRLRSSSTASGGDASKRRHASSPSETRSAAIPSRARYSPSTRARSGSSSTTSTRIHPR